MSTSLLSTERLRRAALNRMVRYVAKDVRHLKSSDPVLTISFDDVPRSAVTEGARILDQHGAKATWFVSGSFKADDSDGVYFSADDLRGLAREGHEIGCHGFDHLDFQQATPNEIAKDLDRNAAFFDGLGLQTARSFAYPYGRATPKAKKLCGERFAVCRSVHPGLCGKIVDVNLLPSYEFYDSCLDIDDVKNLLNQLAKSGGLLSLFSHGVCDTPAYYDCSPSLLQGTLEYASVLGIRILPLNQAIDRLYPKE